MLALSVLAVTATAADTDSTNPEAARPATTVLKDERTEFVLAMPLVRPVMDDSDEDWNEDRPLLSVLKSTMFALSALVAAAAVAVEARAAVSVLTSDAIAYQIRNGSQ